MRCEACDAPLLAGRPLLRGVRRAASATSRPRTSTSPTGGWSSTSAPRPRSATRAACTTATRTPSTSSSCGTRSSRVVCDGVSTAASGDAAARTAADGRGRGARRGASATAPTISRRRPSRRSPQRRRRRRGPRRRVAPTSRCRRARWSARSARRRDRDRLARRQPRVLDRAGRRAPAHGRRLLGRRAGRRRPAEPRRGGTRPARARDHALGRRRRPGRPAAVRRARPRDAGPADPLHDGVWNYAPSRGLVAALEALPAEAAPRRRAHARRHALERGGHDNITVRSSTGPRGGGRNHDAFTAETYQNEYLADGATEVNAIVTVTASGGAAPAEPVRRGRDHDRRRVGLDGHAARQDPGRQAGDRRRGRLHPRRRPFAVIAGTDPRPASTRPPAAGRRVAQTREDAKDAIEELRRSGGTAIGTWLTLAAELFARRPGDPPRDPAHRRPEPARDARAARRGARALRGALPVRLPRRRHRLGGRRAAPDRLGPARHVDIVADARRPRRRLHRDDRAPRWARRPTTSRCACGRRRARRWRSSSRSRRRSRT